MCSEPDVAQYFALRPQHDMPSVAGVLARVRQLRQPLTSAQARPNRSSAYADEPANPASDHAGKIRRGGTQLDWPATVSPAIGSKRAAS